MHYICNVDQPGAVEMSKKLAARLAETVHALRRDLAVADQPEKFPEYLDPLLREVRETIEAIERRRDQLRSKRAESEPKTLPETGKGIQKREALIDTLGLLRRPAAPATVSKAAAVAFDVDIAPSQFASMRKGDERAYMRGRRRRVILVPALSASDLTARARTITLSDWPLEKRIIGNLSERVDAFHVMRRLVDLAKAEPERKWLSVLQPLANDFRFQVKSADELPALWDKVDGELKKIEAKDIEDRSAAASRAAKLPESRRLFGAFIGIDNEGEQLV
jgi:hypothetical protein